MSTVPHTPWTKARGPVITKVQPGVATVYNLTVIRGFHGTAIAAHTLGSSVLKTSYDTVIQVTPSGVSVNDVIQIDNEQMMVTAVFGANPETVIVVRGINGTTEAAHNANVNVFQVVGDTTIQVKANNGQVTAGMVIQIDAEQMLVDAVTSAGGVWNLNVERGFNGTTEATHTATTEVKQIADETIVVKNAGTTTPVAPGDVIQIDSEQMLVVAVNSGVMAGTWTLTVQRGYSGTTEALHNQPATVFLIAVTGASASPTPCEIPTGPQTLFPGTYYGGICIGAAVGSNCVNSGATTACKAAGGATTTTRSYSPVVKVAMDETGDDTVHPGYETLVVDNPAPITVGDLIAVDDEEMTVTAISGNSLTVTREANGTEDGDHLAGTQVFQVITTPNGTQYSDKETLDVTTPITTTTPGTISFVARAATTTAGGGVIATGDVIQIGGEAMTVTAHSQKGANPSQLENVTVTRPSDFTTATTHPAGAAILLIFLNGTPPPPTVTLTKGVYIMAGGGFSVCGAGSVRAPNGVLIYNTVDADSPTGNGALGQVDINTSGNVHLGPMTSGDLRRPDHFPGPLPHPLPGRGLRRQEQESLRVGHRPPERRAAAGIRGARLDLRHDLCASLTRRLRRQHERHRQLGGCHQLHLHQRRQQHVQLQAGPSAAIRRQRDAGRLSPASAGVSR